MGVPSSLMQMASVPVNTVILVQNSHARQLFTQLKPLLNRAAGKISLLAGFFPFRLETDLYLYG